MASQSAAVAQHATAQPQPHAYAYAQQQAQQQAHAQQQAQAQAHAQQQAQAQAHAQQQAQAAAQAQQAQAAAQAQQAQAAPAQTHRGHGAMSPLPSVSQNPADRWKVFERLGLGPNAAPQSHAKRQKFIVSAYRGLGFLILTVIVVVLIGYIATSAFYFVSDSWVQPMVVSPADEQVIQLNTKLTEQQNVRDEVLAEIRHVERVIANEQEFQDDFIKAVSSDLMSRKERLERLRKLVGDYSSVRQKIQKSNRAFAKQSKFRTAAEFSAGLIDSTDFVSRKYQLAQIANSNLTLAERAASIETSAEELEQESRALASIISADEKGDDRGPLSYDVLQIKRQFEGSRITHAKAVEQLKALKASLARHQAIIDGIRQSPYLRASDQKATIAFVPYDNLESVEEGASLYGCALEMIFCGEVGKVVEVLPGEVKFKHPHREELLRGQMIEIKLTDEDSAYDRVLFSGGRPLLL